MDAATVGAIAGLALTGGTSLVVITLYAANTRGRADAAAHKARNVEQALSGHIAHSELVFVRKETIEPQLAAIRKSLDEITAQQSALMNRLMGGPV
jgi:phage shock protein A